MPSALLSHLPQCNLHKDVSVTKVSTGLCLCAAACRRLMKDQRDDSPPKTKGSKTSGTEEGGSESAITERVKARKSSPAK